VNDELEWIWKEVVMENLSYYPGIYLERLRTIKITGRIANLWAKN
jgi:hypothetical protein